MSVFKIAPNGRNYMQLGIAGFVPVEPRCRCCGLRTLLSAPKPQLTYSFCYQQTFLSHGLESKILLICHFSRSNEPRSNALCPESIPLKKIGVSFSPIFIL